MRYGIIPDCHDEIDKVQAIMDTTPNIDLWIHLGDYFDSWTGGVKEAEATARRVKTWLDDPLIVNVMGNHDLSYGWGMLDRIHQCSGWTRRKHDAINGILKRGDWNKFVLHFWADGWLVSHAGFDQAHLYGGLSAAESVDVQCANALRVLHSPYSDAMYGGSVGHLAHPMLMAGRDRGGRDRVGGILWADFDTLQGPPGLNQLVGHTPSRCPVIEHGRGGEQLVCIDTALRHFAVIEDGHLEIKNAAD